jgi:hypothetical protein
MTLLPNLLQGPFPDLRRVQGRGDSLGEPVDVQRPCRDDQARDVSSYRTGEMRTTHRATR